MVTNNEYCVTQQINELNYIEYYIYILFKLVKNSTFQFFFSNNNERLLETYIQYYIIYNVLVHYPMRLYVYTIKNGK